jgi:hypothetical protein
MPDEHIVFNRHSLADKGVTRYFAVLPYPGIFLNFDKDADFGVVAYFAPIEVYEVMNFDVFAKFDIRCN